MNTLIIDATRATLENIVNGFKKRYLEDIELTTENSDEINEEIIVLSKIFEDCSAEIKHIFLTRQHGIYLKQQEEKMTRIEAERKAVKDKAIAKEEFRKRYALSVANFNHERLAELPEAIVLIIASYLSTKKETKRWKRTFHNDGFTDVYTPKFEYIPTWALSRAIALDVKWTTDYKADAIKTLIKMSVPDLKIMWQKFKKKELLLGDNYSITGLKKSKLLEDCVDVVQLLGSDDDSWMVQSYRKECLTLILAGKRLSAQNNKGNVLVKKIKKNAEPQSWRWIHEDCR